MKLKRIVCLTLSFILMVSMFSMTSVIAIENATRVKISSVSETAGAIANVNVMIENNPGILGATLTFDFSSELELMGASNGEAFSPLQLTLPGIFTSPCNFVWDGQELLDEDVKDGVILTLRFKIPEDAVAGTKYKVSASYTPNDILDNYLNPVNLEVVDGYIEVNDFTYGDVNSDKAINSGDTIMIRRHIAGGYKQDNFIQEAADVNVDSSINSGDTILVRRHIAGGYGITFPYMPNGCVHVMQAYPAKDATEETEGNIAYWYCKSCKKYFKDEKGVNEITYAETILPVIPKSEYTIQFMCDMVPIGTDNKPVSYEPDTYKPTQTKVLPSPKMDKYEFLGWSDQNGIMYGTEIPKGTTGDLVLYANWVSNRNKSVKKSKLGDPIILEDSDEGTLLFAYEIGTIENVPLYTTLDLQCANGIITTVSVSEQEEISEENAIQVAETISNATTNTTSWNLSNDWERTTEKGNEISQSDTETNEDYSSRINSSIFTKSESNTAGGSSSFINTNSNSYNISENQSHRRDWGVDTESNYEYTTDDKLNTNLSTEVSAGFGPCSAKVEAGVSTESSVHESQKYKINTTNSGTDTWDNHMDSGETNTNSSTSSKTWNSTAGSTVSNGVTAEEGYKNILSKEIAEKYHYGESFAEGGSKSESAAFASNETTTNGRTSTVAFHTSNIKTLTKQFQSTGNTYGSYRMVQAGTMHVFGIVRYDVAEGVYSTYTYNVLDDEVKEYLDYSYDGSFDDYESGVIPFEIPYYINDYVNNRLYRTEGLKLNATTGMITGYNPTGDKPDNIVFIPSYWQVNNNDGTYSSIKVKGIVPGLFEGNTDITAVKLGKFITDIPDDTFKGCTNLKYVMAPGITSVGNNSFDGCESLTEFRISEDIKNVGENAFNNVPGITAVASSVEVAKAIAESGADNVVLDISKISEEENNNLEIEIGAVNSFKLIGQSKEYKGLSVKSDAKTTVINGVTFTENTKIPMEFSSENVTLDNVTVDCSGYALALKAAETNVTLNKEINLISKDENAVIAKSVNLSELDSSYVGSLNVTGNILTCGSVNDNGLLKFAENKGEIITLTEEDYENYLTSRKVTFDAGEGNVDVEYVIVPYNGLMGELPQPRRDFYTFDGWYYTPQTSDGVKDETRGDEVTSDTTMTSLTDITLYAHWLQNDVSAWVLKSEMPSDAQVVNTEFTYTLTEYTTSGSSSMSGWQKYNETWEWGPWGSWSAWSTTKYYDSDSRDAESAGRSKWVDTSYNLHEYHYYAWVTSKYDAWTTKNYAQNQTGKTAYLQEIWVSSKLTYNKYSGGMDYYVGPEGHFGNTNYFRADGYAGGLTPFERDRWIEQGYTQEWTEWRYRDRSKVYTYYFKRDINDKKSPTYPTGDNISNIQEWVQYRTK